MGGTQKGKIKLWRAMALLEPEVCVDVGANYGEFSSVIADLGLPIIAVEANHTLVSCMESSFAGHNNVVVVHTVASDSGDMVPFFVNPRATGKASLSKQVAQNQVKSNAWGGWIEEVKVPSCRLDTLVPEVLGRQPESLVLKIDVEGFEDSVLRGATSLLSGLVWWRGLIEFYTTAIQGSGGDPNQVWDMLREFPGVVVGKPGQETEPFHLNSILPSTPPPRCDVVIGQGMPPDLEGTKGQ